jgi:hypothetical protein
MSDAALMTLVRIIVTADDTAWRIAANIAKLPQLVQKR